MAEPKVEVESTYCVVCVEVIDGIKRLPTFGPCNHVGVCSLCYLRIRQLMKEDTCVLCKSPMDRVMVCKAENIRAFQDFEIWGDNAGPEYHWDDKSRMFLPKFYYRDFVLPLQEYACGVEECHQPRCSNMSALERHLREKHHLSFCKVCLKHRKVFLMEQVRYTGAELQQHIVKGDAKLGQAGHPRCEFCKIRFYDSTQLHEHLVKDHYSCHICEKRGVLYKYYRDYSDLERHFRSDHFLCEEEECLEKKFVVFENEIDLRAHTLSLHPNRPAARTIKVNFTIKRSNWDGTGNEDMDGDEEKIDDEVHEWTYEGEIGPQADPPEVLAARREAARQAARAAGMVGLPIPPPQAVEEFPSLSRDTVVQASGWAARLGSNRPRAEDFPALNAPNDRGGWSGGRGAGGRGSVGRGGSRGGGGRGGGGGRETGANVGSGTSFRSAVEAYPTRAQELATSGPGDGNWCFDYPMPPPDPPASSGKAGGVSRRVAGIGNMKLKVDKKAGKRKSKPPSSRDDGGGGGGGLVEPEARENHGQSPPSGMPYSPTTPVEDIPDALSSARAFPGSTASVPSEPSQPRTLAQSIAAQQRTVVQGVGQRSGGSVSVVSELRELLGEAGFSEVKELSAAYRSGAMAPEVYLRAMQERLPEERFGELFQGLIDILPDEEKKQEMLSLLAASRSTQPATPSSKASPSKNDTSSTLSSGEGKQVRGRSTEVEASVVAARRTSNGVARQAQSPKRQSPQRDDWPGVSADSSSGKKPDGASGRGKVGANHTNAGAKRNPTASPGSASTWLRAMNSGSNGKTGGTGIAVVRTRGGGSASISASRGRSASPPPGVPLRRKGDDEDGYQGKGIGDAGASWATQGGSGFRGSKGSGGAAAGANSKGGKASLQDYPGLPGVDTAPSGSSGGMGASSGRMGLAARVSAAPGASPSPPPPRPPVASSSAEFPGLPVPSRAPPGMERLDWGASAARSGAGGDSGSGSGSGGGGKGAKKKNKQKASKEALKGMAFGFR